MGAITSLIGSGLSSLSNSGYSTGGSESSSYNMSGNFADSLSTAQSQIDGDYANENAAEAARVAYERQKQLLLMQMEFNAKEAQKERDWNENMANTIYTRSTKNMKEAGINPVLAASMGLSGASVGSGATASVGGATAPMAQTFANQSSSSNSWSHSEGSAKGGSHGESWTDSKWGLGEAITGLDEAAQDAVGKVNSARQTLEEAVDANITNKYLNAAIKAMGGILFPSNPIF